MPEPSSAQKPRQPPTKNLDPLSKEELLQQVRSKPKAKGDKPPSKKDGGKKRENSTEPRSQGKDEKMPNKLDKENQKDEREGKVVKEAEEEKKEEVS